jgi:truncated hemoglobin YjbI
MGMSGAALVLSFLAALFSSGALFLSFLAWRAATDPENTGRHLPSKEVKVDGVVVPEKGRAKLFDPPMLDGMTMRDWLRYHWASQIWNDGDIWEKVVDDFYDDAASNPIILQYFDPETLPNVKRKFLATLLIVTHSGVNVASADTLVKRHAHLGITGEAYDATMAALVRTLYRYKVPESGVRQMMPMLMELRKGLVTA